MKKAYLAVLALPLLLTGCGASTDPTALPNKGTEVSAEVGKAAMKKAFVATVNRDDAIGFSLKKGKIKMSTDANVNMNMGAAMEGYGNGAANTSIGVKADFHAEDITYTGGLTGWMGDNVSDFKESVKASANVGYKADITTGGTTSTTEMKTKKCSAATYIQNGFVYADFSDEATMALIKKAVGFASGFSTGIDASVIGNGKVKADLGLTDEDFPVLKSDEAKEEATELEKTADEFVKGFVQDGTEAGVFKDHGDGTYSYTQAVTGPEIIKAAESYMDGDLAGKIPLSSFNLDEKDSLALVVIFDQEEGLTSIGFETVLDMDVNLTAIAGAMKGNNDEIGDAVGGMAPSGNINIKLDVSLKLNILKGKKVTIDSVEDPDSYTEIKEKNPFGFSEF